MTVSPEAMVSAACTTALMTRVPRCSWRVALGDTVLSEYRSSEQYPSASMIKTFLCAAAVDLCADWEHRIEITDQHLAVGDGVAEYFDLPATVRIGDLVVLVIALSDNTATNALIEACGGLEPVNQWLERRGYTARMMRWLSGAGPEASDAGKAESGIGLCSAREHAQILAYLSAQRSQSPRHERLWTALTAQQDRRSLGRFIREDRVFAHKTGTVAGLRHDSGIIEQDNRALSMSVFTDGGPEDEWLDHPACIGMGLAAAWSCALVGCGDAVVTAAPSVPPLLLGDAAVWSTEELDSAFREPTVAESRGSVDREIAFWDAIRGAESEASGWAILDEGRPIGLVGLYDREPGGVPDLGIHLLDPSARRRGKARWAVEQAMRVAAVRGISEVRWTAAATDVASLALAAACGFVRAETRRPARTSPSGETVDEVVLLKATTSQASPRQDAG